MSKNTNIVKSKSMIFILWLFFLETLFVSIIHGSQPLDQRNHSPSAASTSTAQWARPRARALRYLRCTRCLSQEKQGVANKKIDITSLVVFFILENKPKIIQIFVFLVFGLSYIIQTIGNAQTFLLFGFPKKILPLLRPIACRSLQCPCGRRASKARKT